MNEFLMGALVGFSAGAAAMWWHFHSYGLIRTRAEWLAAKGQK